MGSAARCKHAVVGAGSELEAAHGAMEQIGREFSGSRGEGGEGVGAAARQKHMPSARGFSGRGRDARLENAASQNYPVKFPVKILRIKVSRNT